MQLTICFLALAAFAAKVVIAHDDDRNWHMVTCETSDASPYIHHIDQMIINLKDEDFGHKDVCFEDNLGYTDDKCGATIKDFTGKNGGAVFSICSGEIDRRRPSGCTGGPPGIVSCEDCEGWSRTEIARMIENVRDKCKNPHRSGGYYTITAPNRRRGGQVRLYTIPPHK